MILSHAAKEIGYGWAFGVHEALDRTAALPGPLAVAGVLVLQPANIIPTTHDYRMAFAFLGITAVIMLSLLMVAWRTYPHPENLEKDSSPQDLKTRGLPRVVWVYASGAALAAIGIGGFPLMAYHLQIKGTVDATWIPVFYAVAMGVSGGGSLLFGRLFDKVGMWLLVPLTLASAVALPLSGWAALVHHSQG